MPAQQEFDAAAFADRLAAMTDEEVFLMMQKLEEGSERIPPKDRDDRGGSVCLNSFMPIAKWFPALFMPRVELSAAG